MIQRNGSDRIIEITAPEKEKEKKNEDQEKDHLKKFNELMVAFRVRPTILMPFWNVVGFALGTCLSRRACVTLGIWDD